tara:strand:+ start:1670 stop:1816 length:147 start_codon:yes stop_codon:yes gene_type:complete
MPHFDVKNAIGMYQSTHLSEALSEYQENTVYFYAACRGPGATSGKSRE